jgi:hypothetical protein
MCLKPVVILSAIILLDDLYPPPPFGNVLFTILELIPTLIIVYSFKHVFIDNRAAWIFLAGDIILWLGFIISGSFPEPYVDIAGYFFLYLYPLLYAVIGFAIVRKRTINRNAIHY